jgi:hypothetical protein
MQQLNIDQILASLEFFDRKYKRKQVEAALKQREEIIPHLIDILKKVSDNPNKYLEKENYFAHIYALMLLGHFKEPSSHQVIIDLFSLPEPIPEELFGDTITEDLPIILIRTCNGSIEGIKSLALNKNAYEFCRGSALQAIVYAVIEGILTREKALSFLGSLFTGEEADPSSHFYDQLACYICDLYPESLMETIKQAYENKLISPGYISLKDFEFTLLEGQENCLEEVQEEFIRRSGYLDNIHDSIASWCYFQPETKPSLSVDLVANKILRKSKKKIAKTAKIKKSPKKKRGFGV